MSGRPDVSAIAHLLTAAFERRDGPATSPADEAMEVLLALARDAQVDAGMRRAAYDSLKAVLGGVRERQA